MQQQQNLWVGIGCGMGDWSRSKGGTTRGVAFTRLWLSLLRPSSASLFPACRERPSETHTQGLESRRPEGRDLSIKGVNTTMQGKGEHPINRSTVCGSARISAAKDEPCVYDS